MTRHPHRLSVFGCGLLCLLVVGCGLDLKGRGKGRGARTAPEVTGTVPASPTTPEPSNPSPATSAPATPGPAAPVPGARSADGSIRIGVGLGLTADELARAKGAAGSSRLGQIVRRIEKRANAKLPVPDVRPGRHLTTEGMVGDVPKAEALPLGYLQSYNDSIDDVGLAFLLSGDDAYARCIGRHLAAWAKYSPPDGHGKQRGAEPSVMHRQFFAFLRAVSHVWPALGPKERADAVAFSRTLIRRLEDWWERTPWVRGNHMAATNQVGLHAALVLELASRTDPGTTSGLVPGSEAERRIRQFLTAGADLSPETVVLGKPERGGLLGFERQVLLGIYDPSQKALYGKRYDDELMQEGASLDFCYKPRNKRMEYHCLLLHHVLVTYWVVKRNGLEELFDDPGAVHAQIGRLLEFTRVVLEERRAPRGASGKAPDVQKTPLTREAIVMGARLFPEKRWLAELAAASGPRSTAEFYYEVAAPPR